MSINSKDFETFGKVASKRFIENNVPLNDTITKLAKEYGLNRDQISRVVENANVETHLKLYKEAEDKYIEFDTADPNKVISNLDFDIEKSAAVMNDYEDIAESQNLRGFSGYSDEDAERISEANKRQLKKKAEDVTAILNNRLEEIDQNFERESSDLYNNIKQAALASGEFSQIRHAAKMAVPEKITDTIINTHEKRLKKEAAAKVDFSEKDAPKGTLNEDSSIVKGIKKLSTLKERYIELKKVKDALEKHAASKAWRAVGDIIKGLGSAGKGTFKIGGQIAKVPFKHPIVSGLAGASAISYAAGKRQGDIKKSPTNLKYKGNYVKK